MDTLLQRRAYNVMVVPSRDPKDGELYLDGMKPGETSGGGLSDTDVQIVRIELGIGAKD